MDLPRTTLVVDGRTVVVAVILFRKDWFTVRGHRIGEPDERIGKCRTVRAALLLARAWCEDEGEVMRGRGVLRCRFEGVDGSPEWVPAAGRDQVAH